jgi:putative endopeptidase
MFKIIILTALTALLCACQQPESGIEEAPDTAEAPEVSVAAETARVPQIGAWGVDLANRDISIRPGDDFFAYANGTWLATYELPADKTSFGSFQALHERSQERIQTLVQELTEADPTTGSVEQKIRDYYASFLDTDSLDALGIEPLIRDLQTIAAISDLDQLAAVFADADLLGTLSPLSAGIEIDRMNPDRWIVGVSLSGLGLPDRDYYLEDTERFIELREAYLVHIEKMLSLAGWENAAESAAAIMAVETAVAELQWPRADRRNRDLTYNLKTLETVEADYPGFPWRTFLAIEGEVPDELNVRHPSVMVPLLALIAETDLAVWRAYLTYNLVSSNAFALTAAVDDANFDFRGRILAGQPEQRQRWRRAISLVAGQSGLGDALGQVYVARYFPPESKVMMEELVANLREALRQRIEALDWMTADTKKLALEKLAGFTQNIGYPDQWKDYSSINIAEGDLLGNIRRLRECNRAQAIARLSTPTDRHEWFMPPPTVNAYYVAQFNSITFPAGILDAPFFDPAADPAVNYGGIGAVIGHEIGHGFDDQGSKSDARGVQRDWWTPEDRARFEALGDKLITQYSAYEPVPGTFINGETNLGENIGDLGGLNMAYYAYRLSLGGEEAPILDGLTGDQRFFLAYAQIWRGKMREETLLNRLNSGVHSPNEFRVNGVVRNMDAWYEAFDVGPEDAMYLPPDQLVRIW